MYLVAVQQADAPGTVHRVGSTGFFLEKIMVVLEISLLSRVERIKRNFSDRNGILRKIRYHLLYKRNDVKKIIKMGKI